jgi:subtilase family serine protease
MNWSHLKLLVCYCLLQNFPLFVSNIENGIYFEKDIFTMCFKGWNTMQRRFVRIIFPVCLLLLVISAGFVTVRTLAYVNNPTYVPLGEHNVPLLAQSQQVQEEADPEQRISLSLSLRWRNAPALVRLLRDLYDPRSPSYHRFLRPEQFHQRFAPTTDQVNTITAFLQQQGLRVEGVTPNNLLINTTGTIEQIQKAFKTNINMYSHNKRIFYANTTNPSLPATLSPLVTSINGLDGSFHFEPRYRQQTEPLTHPFIQKQQAVDQNGYTPSDLAKVYNALPLQQAGLKGENQTIALFELDGYSQSDIEHYFDTYNLGTPNLSNVLVNGATGIPGFNALEPELDIEIIGALAPKANMIVYQGPNNTQGINSTFSRIVNDNRAKIVSISWGYCEEVTGYAEIRTLNSIFAQGAAQGMAFFAASGDAGAYDCQDDQKGVSYPASDPYVTGVGGTTLTLNEDGTRQQEIAWSNPNVKRGPMGSGSGGGLSSYFGRPSWQSGDGVQNSYSNGKRSVPDVSANADPATGYAIYCTVASAWCPSSGWLKVGGTSAAAPLWAAGMALVNQYMQNAGEDPVGYANPQLYRLFNEDTGTAFNDITQGSNLFYPATTGYDLATGIGAPNFHALALALSGQIPPNSPTPTPTPSTVIAQDTFKRSNQAFWGTSSDGQNWSGDANNLNTFSINNNAGQISNGNNNYDALLGATATNAEVLFTGSISAFNDSNIGSALRWNNTNNWYKAYIDGKNLVLQKKVNGATTVLSSVPFSAKSNTSYTLRFQVVGSTLSARVWQTDTVEPENWMATTTDTTFQAGYCGLRIRVPGGVIARVTAFSATALN